MAYIKQHIALLVAFMIPTLWLVGAHVADISRGVWVITFSLLASKTIRQRHFPLYKDNSLPKWVGTYSIGFLPLFCLLIPIYLVTKVFTGSQGIDFAIFAQVIDSVSRWGDFSSSLISETSVNFLSHHFVPFLAIPGLFGFIGIPSYIAGPIIHGFFVLLGIGGIFRLTKDLDFPRSIGLLVCLFVLINPSYRHAIFWGIHDETFAVGLIPWMFVAWRNHKHIKAVVLALLCCLMKESMFLMAAMFATMAILDTFVSCQRKNSEIWSTDFIPYLTLFVLSVAGFVAYFFLQPLLFNKEFDHFNKIANVNFLFSRESVSSKGLWIAYLLMPFLALPLWKIRTWHYLLPAAPFVGIVLVSGFPEMYKLNNYYAVVPTLIVAIATILAIGQVESRSMLATVNPILILFIVSLCFSFATSKPTKEIVQNIIAEEKFYPNQLSSVPENSIIIATPSAALFLQNNRLIHRLYLANRTNLSYDYLVTQSSEVPKINQTLLSRATKCMKNERWTVWCNKGRKLALNQ